MMEDLEFRIIETQEAREEYRLIQRGLTDHAMGLGLPAREDINLFCYREDQLIGATVGNIVLPHFNIKYLWVHPNYRKRNLGTILTMRVEKMVMQAGCDTAFVDTMSYQAPGFYARFGYKEVARIKDFHPGHDRIFYKKKLT